MPRPAISERYHEGSYIPLLWPVKPVTYQWNRSGIDLIEKNVTKIVSLSATALGAHAAACLIIERDIKTSIRVINPNLVVEPFT
jgi:hypothetical protein